MKKITPFLLLISCLIILLVSSCSKDDHFQSSEKELFSFSFPDSLNPYLSKTITGEIEDSKIRLALPGLTNQKDLIASFDFKGKELLINGVPQKSGGTENDFSENLIYQLKAEDGSIKEYAIQIELIPEIPHLYIQTENDEKITSKDNYITADLKIDGKEIHKDFEGRTGIRGRGNSSWALPKKPYKLKLDSKEGLFGLVPAKKWILLAEYLDGSMLYNAVPFKMGEMLGIPYTNHIIPVEVTLNGEYQGFYAFTEHKEVKEGRIDIGEEGWLLELDSYFDEPLKFKSDKYQLPVMLQYPKADDMSPEEGLAVLHEVKKDFEKLENLIFDDSFPRNGYLDLFDHFAFVNYMLVYQLTKNSEISHPKSTYINKKKDGKYNMGIIWDFDWGFGYSNTQHYRLSTANSALLYGDAPGTQFFNRIMEDPYIRAVFKVRWDWFRINHFEELKAYVKAYAEQVSQAYKKDHDIWGKRDSTGDLEKDLDRLLTWLDARAEYLDNLFR